MNMKQILLAVLCMVVSTRARSVGVGNPRRCEEDLTGQCLPWSAHALCDPLRQHATSDCGSGHFCCAGPMHTLVESTHTTHWYGTCGIPGTPDPAQKSRNPVVIGGGRGRLPSRGSLAPGAPSAPRPSSVPAALVPSEFIIGGTQASQGQFPWMASILKDGTHFCGATLIDDKFVLTAAHCIEGPAATYTVILGSLQIQGGDQSSVYLGASSLHLHEGYEGTTANDIGMIRLNRSVGPEISTHIGVMPACPPDVGVDYAGRTGYVAGWGKTRYPIGMKSQTLQYTAVSVMSYEQCCTYHCTEGCNKPTCALHSYNLCAGHPTGGHDACSGDSGGPLVVDMGGSSPLYHLVGIVSWGSECGLADSPGVYIDVKQFLTWIEDIRVQYG